MTDETPKGDERETPQAEEELEPTPADEAAATEAAPDEDEAPAPRRSRRKAAEPAAEEDADAAAEEADEDEADEDELEPTAEDEEAADEAASEDELDEDEEDALEEEPEEAPAPAARRRRLRGRRAAEEEEPAPAPARRAPLAPGERVVVRAQAKYVRTSARKARLVCDHIRGKSVQDARAILAHTPRAVSRDWSKLLESAVANAEHNHELLGDDLYIASVTADEGPTLKRYRPRAMGRATRIRKRTSHLTILLTPKES
jgi:large subunit ribosomal protein L22